MEKGKNTTKGFTLSILRWTSIDLLLRFNLAIIYSVRGLMIIVVGNGHGDTSSNPGRDWLHFTQR